MPDLHGRPLGTAPGEAFHVSNAIHDTRSTKRASRWEGVCVAIYAAVALWAVGVYLFFYHV